MKTRLRMIQFPQWIVLASALLTLSACGEQRGITAGEVEVEQYTGDAGPDYVDGNTSGTSEDEAFCAANDDCAFGMACLDGVCIELNVGQGEEIGCVSDSDCPSGFECADSTGFCVEATPVVSEPTESDACFDGQWRKCGTKLGACEYGQEFCVDGTWSGVCEGGVSPSAEICNGIDDDCDGEIPADEIDADGDGISECAGDCDDTTSLVAPGVSDTCNGIDDDCDGDIDEDGALSCDDGLYCNGVESCGGGTCQPGAAVVCPSTGIDCMASQCDESQRACASVPVADGTVCNDGNLCTLNDTCSAGTCNAGPSVDCSAFVDACNDGACNPANGLCESVPAREGASCEDGLFCTVGDSCSAGSCIGGGTRDCSIGVSEPACFDISCNEIQNTCDYSDNGTCDPCLAGGPVAVAGVDQEVVPDTWVNLDGSGSYTTSGASLTYSWAIASRPSGSQAQIQNAGQANASLLGDVSGDYQICLTVGDSNNCEASQDCIFLTVKPQVALHIELTWDTGESDIDLHYRAPFGNWFTNGDDVYYLSMTPDWGGNNRGQPDSDSSNDPRLDVDNILGYGPENINQDLLFDNPAATADSNFYFSVGVHYFCDRTYSSAFWPWESDSFQVTTARIRVYLDGELAYEASQQMTYIDFWEPLDIIVSDNGTRVDLYPVAQADGSSWMYAWGDPSCH